MLEVQALYEQFGSNGLQYGPYFRGIRRLCRGPDEVLAEIEAHPELEINAGRDVLHPTLVDACFQALIAALPPGLYLPIRINRVSVLDHLPARLLTHGRITRRTRQYIDGDIELTDEQGRLLAEIKGLRCQIIATQPRTDDADVAEGWSYAYQWEQTATVSVETSNAEPGRWVIFTDRCFGRKLAVAMTQRGADCLTVCDAPEFKQVGPDEIHVRADSREDLQRVIELARPEHCRGVVYLSALDAGDANDPVGQRACVAALHLVQVLSALGDPRKPRLFMVTRGAFELGIQAQPAAPAQASVWGLGRVVMNEHPDLRCALIDIDPDQELNSLPHLAAELLTDTPEEEIALRGMERHVHRLDRVDIGAGVAEDAAVRLPTTEPFEMDIVKQEVSMASASPPPSAGHPIRAKSSCVSKRSP